ncbi:MAG: UPF0104 family protein [Chromatiaceae bacterium]|nr:MAG: UPF0104 family protein [Chromatiaceae bacterium]
MRQRVPPPLGGPPGDPTGALAGDPAGWPEAGPGAGRASGPEAASGAARLRLGRGRDWLLGAALLAGLILAVALGVGWGELLSPWASLSPRLLAAAVGLTAASYLARAVRVHDYFGALTAGRFRAVLRLSVLHTTANNLLPMRIGELLFPWLMRRYFGHGFLAAGTSLGWIRLLDLHFFALTALLILWLREPAWSWPLLALGWVALGWVALVPASDWLRERLPMRSAEAAGVSHGGLGRLRALAGFILAAAPRGPARIARLYLWTALTWTLKFIAFAVILHHFVALDFWRELVGVMGAELSSILPVHGIAGTGSYELATLAALVPLGVGPEAALIGAVNLHLFVLGTTLLLGSAALALPVGRPAGSPSALGSGAGAGP